MLLAAEPGQIAIVAAAVTTVLTAVALVFRLLVRPVWRVFRQAEQVVPILTEIALQFRPDHGTSLHDRITQIGDGVEQISDLTSRVERVEELVRQMRDDMYDLVDVIAGSPKYPLPRRRTE